MSIFRLLDDCPHLKNDSPRHKIYVRLMRLVCYPLWLDRKCRLNVCQRWNFSLRFVSSSSALLVAPVAPTNFTATADPNGELKATLQFTVPSTDVKGTALSSVDKIVIRRNAETIKEYGKTEAGKTITYVDENVPVAGFNAYEVAAYTGDDCGDWALQNQYGVDPKRLTAGGRGEYNPLTNNNSDVAKQRNRRTQIIITPKLDQFMDLIDKAPEEK